MTNWSVLQDQGDMLRRLTSPDSHCKKAGGFSQRLAGANFWKIFMTFMSWAEYVPAPVGIKVPQGHPL